MERPHAIPNTRQVHWTATPSEEQLLGSPRLATASGPAVSFEPPPPHDWAVVDEVGPPTEPTAASPRWRPQARDLIVLAAVGAAVWLAVRGADGVPFRSIEAATPTTADGVTARVLADRQELSSLPREPGTTTHATGVASGEDKNGKHDSGSSGPGGGTEGDGEDPPATGGDKKNPLLQATVPGVGSVTVEQPDVPESGLPLPDVPDVPETEIAIPGTATVSLP
jgi:hypothetical protein